ncbi:ABC transporter ATP-binding protein, partial [Lactobacillus sp. XV13L]|nr:ABC transporter ATP-binding protein [Lactobacillus sp. XV13L]
YAGVCDCLFKFAGKSVIQLDDSAMNQLLAENDHHGDVYTFALPQAGENFCFALKRTQVTQNRLLLDQDHLDIPRGKATLITGANGVGKTSLFSALTKMIPYSGSLTYREKEIRRQTARTYLRRVGQIFQTASDQFINITVKDEIALSKKQRTGSFFTDQKIKEALADLELDALLDHVVYSLSGGQQKKLQILLMLIADLDVLLIDEPLSGLDHESLSQVMTWLKESQKQRGQTLLIISHELAGLADWCDYHLVFKNRRLTYVDK